MKKISENNLPLSYDPDENKRMENELLQLKLKAELGLEAHISANIPPSVENIFLKNMLAFEEGLLRAKETSKNELIGKPYFMAENAIDDHFLEIELKKLMELINQNQIAIDFLGDYDNRTKYKFLTEELFEEQVMNMHLPNMIMHCIYEDFHPNHKMDIKQKTEKFISSWFRKKKENLLFSLADEVILPDGNMLKKEKIINKLANYFDAYTSFENEYYSVDDINFEVKDDMGLAYAEGRMKYIALTEDLSVLKFEGSFKLYFTLEYDWWSIYFFIIPGFDISDF